MTSLVFFLDIGLNMFSVDFVLRGNNACSGGIRVVVAVKVALVVTSAMPPDVTLIRMDVQSTMAYKMQSNEMSIDA